MRRLAAALAVCAPALAFALDTAQWPPPAGVEARMRELQGVLGSREATRAERDAARHELTSLLKSPAGQPRAATQERKPPPRAAIEPLPRIVRPAEGPIPATPGVAQLEVITPPKPVVVPRSGAVAAPSGRAAIDPRTGAVLHEVPGGYIDPRTGQFVPSR